MNQLTMRSPLVSVVMPAFRHEKYVGTAIASVVAQTLDDWELVVIDDYSPDNTWLEICRYTDPRIRALRHSHNRGAPATLNEGISLARGRYVSILNSDDVYHPQRLLRTVTHLETANADLVGTGVRLIDSDGSPVVDPEHPWHRWYQQRTDLVRSATNFYDALLGGNFFVSTSNFVFRAQLAERTGGFAELRYAHDYAFLLEAACASPSGVNFLADQALLDYRWHGSNTIRENPDGAAQEAFDVVRRYLPRFLPVEAQARTEVALRHLAELSDLQIDRLRHQFEAIRSSMSFRLGAALLSPIRRVRTFFGRRL